MKKIIFTLIIVIFVNSTFAIAQSINLRNPQLMYDLSSGLYNIDSLRTMDINFYNPNYDSLLRASWEQNVDLRLPATVEISNGIFLDSVAVRYKGNSTYAVPNSMDNPKLPINLDMNEIISGQSMMGYKKVKLANSMFDPTFCKEVVAYNIYQKYLPSAQANYMKVNLQGNYNGLYVNTESIDKQFLMKHFGESDGILFKCDPIQLYGQETEEIGMSDLAYLGDDTTLYYNHYTIKSDYGWTELLNLISTINNYTMIDSVLNVDRVLWAFAANTVIANYDTYNGFFQHNYYLYQTGDGLFQMIPWDLTESFIGGFLPDSADATFLYEYSPYYGFDCWSKPLVYFLTADTNSLTSKIYTAHIRTILEESLNETEIKNYIDDLQSMIYDAANQDNNKFYSMDLFSYNVDNDIQVPGTVGIAGITSTIAKRKPYLETHPQINKITPEINNVQLTSIDNQFYITANVTNCNLVELRTTISQYNSKFTSTNMYDDGTHGDITANDNIYTAILPHQNTSYNVKFYIRAHNENSIKLSPERAEYDFYIFNPGYIEVGDVVINEFMASNSNYRTDQNGEFDDWIELYNNSDSAISLLGYYLSDDSTDIVQYAFPDTIIPANGYIIVWADNDEEQVGLHAGFKLSATGESLYLVNSTFSIVNKVEFGEQTTDMGFARVPNGTGSFVIQNPTFEANNDSLNNGIAENINNSNIQIYPNPANNSITIEYDSNKKTIFKLWSLTGQTIFEGEINQKINVVNIEALESGIYIINVENSFIKFIKN